MAFDRDAGEDRGVEERLGDGDIKTGRDVGMIPAITHSQTGLDCEPNR